MKEIKTGKELKYIGQWGDYEDELDELKKIFYTFMKQWFDKDQQKDNPNVILHCEVHSDEELFELDSAPFELAK